MKKLEGLRKDAYSRQETRGLEITLLKLIWDFYLENATPSTITSCPANLKISE